MEITLETNERVDVIDVTTKVRDALATDASGVCTVFVPHTTAGIVVNEPEERLLADIETALDRLVPGAESYRHDDIDDNADAHLRSIFLGSSVSIPVEEGSMGLGTWQSVLFVEADGPRRRRIEVTVTTS